MEISKKEIISLNNYLKITDENDSLKIYNQWIYIHKIPVHTTSKYKLLIRYIDEMKGKDTSLYDELNRLEMSH